MSGSKMTIIGRVTKDHSIGVGKAKGTPYLKLNVASDGENGDTVWYNVVAFGGIAKNLMAATGGKKGGEFKFVGRLTQKEYRKNDGGIGVSNDFAVDSVTLEGGRTIDKFTKVEEPSPSSEVQPF